MEHIPCALCKCAEIVVNASCIVYCDLLYRPLEQKKNIFTTVDIIIVFMKFWAPFVAENKNFLWIKATRTALRADILCNRICRCSGVSEARRTALLADILCNRICRCSGVSEARRTALLADTTLQPNLPLLWCLRGKANCIACWHYFATESAAALVSQRQGDLFGVLTFPTVDQQQQHRCFSFTSHPFCFSEQKLSTDIREAILTAKIPLLP